MLLRHARVLVVALAASLVPVAANVPFLHTEASLACESSNTRRAVQALPKDSKAYKRGAWHLWALPSAEYRHMLRQDVGL